MIDENRDPRDKWKLINFDDIASSYKPAWPLRLGSDVYRETICSGGALLKAPEH